MCILLLLVLSIPLFAAPQAASTQLRPVVISHVTVIPMDEERVLEDRTVIVRGGKVQKISGEDQTAPKGALQIDGRGKYLIPGLADLHVHLFSSDDLRAYLFYGVTTVLNMDGGPDHLRWRSQVRAGKIPGPTIYTAGHTIDGWPPLNEMFLTAETAEQGRAIVKEQKRAGYDVIKLYGTLRPDVFRAILASAKEERIPVVGHINRQVGAGGVLQSSQVLAAHLEDLLSARFDHLPTDAELEEFATAISLSRITVTPNLNVNPTNIAQLENLAAVLKSKPAELLSPPAYSQWLPANNRNERNDQTAQQIEFMKGMQSVLYKMVRLLQARKVPLVLGTDAAPYGIPGFSAHQELQELVEAGFSPYAALRTATRNAGDFISQTIPGSPRTGTVTEGAVADLVLLSSNPLNDIRGTQDIAGVVLRGRWFSAAELAGMRKETTTRFESAKRRLEKIDAALESGNASPAEGVAASSSLPGLAEWVLMLKARRLQGKDMAAAIRAARLAVRTYPDSFFARYLLADLLFQTKQYREATTWLGQSLSLEPHNAAALNLSQKIAAAKQPPRFNPAGRYEIEYVNEQSREVRRAVVVLADAAHGEFRSDASGGTPLRSVLAGGDRLWVVSDSPFGSQEFRMVVNGNHLSGYWAGPFGLNGRIQGSKSE